MLLINWIEYLAWTNSLFIYENLGKTGSRGIFPDNQTSSESSEGTETQLPQNSENSTGPENKTKDSSITISIKYQIRKVDVKNAFQMQTKYGNIIQ